MVSELVSQETNLLSYEKSSSLSQRQFAPFFQHFTAHDKSVPARYISDLRGRIVATVVRQARTLSSRQREVAENFVGALFLLGVEAVPKRLLGFQPSVQSRRQSSSSLNVRHSRSTNSLSAAGKRSGACGCRPCIDA